MIPKKIFDGQRLRATLFQGENPDLPTLVAFSHRDPKRKEFSDHMPMQGLHAKGHSILFLQTKLNDWYINSETTDFENALYQVSQTTNSARLIGFSMGGYAALRFAKALDAEAVLAISPQFSIHPSVVPFDKRFHESSAEFDPILGDLSPGRCQKLSGVIYYDPFVALDRLNKDMISKLFPNIQCLALAGGGHPANQLLNKVIKPGLIVNSIIGTQRDWRDIAIQHRKVRGNFREYWQGLADFTAARHPEIAVVAFEAAKILPSIDSDTPQ